MPKTWAELRTRCDLADPFGPHDNIVARVACIRELHDRYGTPGFLAAYKAGPSRHEKYLATGRPLPDETQANAAPLAPMIESKQTDGQIVPVARSFAWVRSLLFPVRAASSPSDDRSSHYVHPGRPLNVRAVVDLLALVPQSGDVFVHRASEFRSQ